MLFLLHGIITYPIIFFLYFFHYHSIKTFCFTYQYVTSAMYFVPDLLGCTPYSLKSMLTIMCATTVMHYVTHSGTIRQTMYSSNNRS